MDNGHYARMVVIPEREYYILKQIREQSIKNDDIHALTPTSLPSDQLMIAYNAEMERQRMMNKQDKTEDEKISAPVSNAWLLTLLDRLPKTYKARASQIYNFILNHPNKISWNGTGEIKTEFSDYIEGSNILDLITYVTNPRLRKGNVPIGLNEFINVLNTINVPRSLINESNMLAYNIQPSVKQSPYKRADFDDKPVGIGSPWKSLKIK